MIVKFLTNLMAMMKGKKAVSDHWNVLADDAQLAEVTADSSNRPQLIYKHSFTCGICVMALDDLQSQIEELAQAADLHFIDVKADRAVSTAAADLLGVRHESPQLIIVRDGKAVWDESHHAIKADEVLDELQKSAS